jgi:hypothetical protein
VRSPKTIRPALCLPRVPLAWLVSAALLAPTLLCSTARAEGPEPAAAAAKAMLATLKQHQAEAVVKEATLRANQALDRAAKKSAPEHAEARKVLEAAALEWARVAKGWVRVLEQERAAKKLEESVAALRTQLGHARALLEETHARKGRAQSILEASRTEAGPAASSPNAAPAKPAPSASPEKSTSQASPAPQPQPANKPKATGGTL